ncbi:SurA N-terminal domain-containing protein [Salinisphaera sp.]|uniref:SurA N-terminal domain-containing protein n=1 Tax=Salinisphaera sp. TaxID=1914330 RepID=UPI002D77A127|nr:SurA N-terminal domain-containing protein [Salinisphaera sp.]HET7313759.1 SurA N-terminal domain-containing protein [Salinisphaera sp.]
MLQKIRDGASGPLAYIVVAVIAVVFGVWGVGSYFTPSADPVVASVGDTNITQSQLQQAFNQRYQRLRQMMGDHFDASMFPRDEIRKNVLDGMIEQAVMTQYARDNGYRVTDANLLALIRSNPQFQDNGRFSTQRYKALLAQAGIPPAQYEARLRRSMVAGQVRQIVAGSAFAAPPEVDAAYRRSHEQRKIEVLRFDPSAYSGQIKVDDQAIKNYYDSHPKQFMRPPRVKLAYVSLDADRLSSDQPGPDRLQQLYQAHKSEFGTPAKRSAKQVRIPIKGGDDAKARQTVQSVIAAVNNGQSLKQAAAANDGAQFSRIDSQAKSALPDAVGSAVFGLKQGELSKPVRGDDAWYVLRTTAVTPAKTPGFDDPVVQARLKAMARDQARAKAFRSKSDKLDSLAYQAPNGLQTISNKLGLKIRHTDWISRDGGGSGLGQYTAVRKAAFSDAVLKDHLNSQVLELGDQRRVVLRVTDHQPAQRKPLTAVRDTIRQRLVAQRAEERAQQAAQQAMAQARQGKPLAQIADNAKGATLSRPGFVGRDNGKLDPKVLDAAFGLPLDAKQSGDAQYKVVSTDDGQAALVVVSASRVQSGDKQGGVPRKQIAQRQAGYNANLEYGALSRYLRRQADVEIHESALN